MLRKLWIPRLFAGAFGIMIFTQLPLGSCISIIFLLSMSHTFLASYYSRRKFFEVCDAGTPQKTLMLFLLLVAAIFIFFDSPPMYYLVLIHHLFNETFTSLNGKSNRPYSLPFRGSFIAFELIVFICCAPVQFDFYILPISFVIKTSLLFVALGAVLTGAFLWVEKKDRLSTLAFVGLGFGAASYSLFVKGLNLDFLVLYHFLFWLIYPSLKSYESKKNWDASYWMKTAFLAVAVMPLTPLMASSISLSIDQMSYLTRLFAYFHILTTVALSSSNPGFITSFFQKPAVLNKEDHEKIKIQSAV